MRNIRYFGPRTKIICTIGPATNSTSAIERLIKAGMNIARLNLSHGTYSEHTTYIQTIRRLANRLSLPVAILIVLIVVIAIWKLIKLILFIAFIAIVLFALYIMGYLDSIFPAL